jgi:hypothetical protein
MITFLGKIFASITLGISALFGGHAVLQTQEVSSATTTQTTPPSITSSSKQIVSVATAILQKTAASVQTKISSVVPNISTQVPPVQTVVAPPPVKTPTSAIVTTNFVSQSTDFSRGYTYTVMGAGQASTVQPSADYDLKFDVTAVSQDLYLPLSTGTSTSSGVNYIITGSFQGTQTAKVTCGESQTVTQGNAEFCFIPAATTQRVDLSISLKPARGEGGTHTIQINSLNYTSNPSSNNYSSYTPKGLQTKGLEFDASAGGTSVTGGSGATIPVTTSMVASSTTDTNDYVLIHQYPVPGSSACWYEYTREITGNLIRGVACGG